MSVDRLFALGEGIPGISYSLLDNLLACNVASVVVFDHHVVNVGVVTYLSFSDWVAFVCCHNFKYFLTVSHKVP